MNSKIFAGGVLSFTVFIMIVSAVDEYRNIQKARNRVGISAARRRYLQIRSGLIVLMYVATFVISAITVISVQFVQPHSPLAQARPYLTFASIVGLATLVGKLALSVAIVPFFKAIPGAIAGIVVKVGWDKWHARKPREPKPQG